MRSVWSTIDYFCKNIAYIFLRSAILYVSCQLVKKSHGPKSSPTPLSSQFSPCGATCRSTWCSPPTLPATSPPRRPATAYASSTASTAPATPGTASSTRPRTGTPGHTFFSIMSLQKIGTEYMNFDLIFVLYFHVHKTFESDS